MTKRFKPYTMEELTEDRDDFFTRAIGKQYNQDWLKMLSEETIEHIRSNRRISVKEYRDSRGNSYDRKTRSPILSNEALIECIEHNLKNCTSVRLTSRYQVDSVYEAALINTLVPVLLDRLEELTKKITKLENT